MYLFNNYKVKNVVNFLCEILTSVYGYLDKMSASFSRKC